VVDLAEVVAVGLVLAGACAVVLGARALALRRREAVYGDLVAVDTTPGAGLLLRSTRFRISGRPDELRRLPDGRLVPIEFKSRSTPRNGVPRSHRVQVAAYCLLVEETTGRAPPYGVVRYGDGGEARVRWDPTVRAELLNLRSELDRPYRGEATPSVARCSHCPWHDVCDVRAA
jgi:CRISPR-associated exonuclease Cas4